MAPTWNLSRCKGGLNESTAVVAAGWVSEKPCHDENDAFEALVAAPATTLPGLVAWLDYFQELSSEFETEWMIEDRAAAAVLIQSFVASLKNIGVQS